MTNDNEARVHDAGDEDEHAWATAATNYLQAYSIMQTAMSDGVNVHGAISGLLAAKDALRSLAASATQVPQGWKLVPVEADDTMKQAGIDVAPSGLLEIRGQLRNRASWSTEECAEVYRAMIEKSPTAPQAATQGEAVAFDASKLKRYDYGYRSDEWGMGRALQTYPKADGPFVLYEDVVALAVINEPAPAPSKEQTNG